MTADALALAAIGFIVVAVVVPIAVALLTDEARAWLPHLTRALVRSAARRLPPAHRDRYQEEWLAEVDAYADRPLTAFGRGCGMWRGARPLGGLLGGGVRVPVLHRLMAAAAILVAAPVLALMASAIRLGSPGPALVRIARVRPDGRQYQEFRFRTLVVESMGSQTGQVRVYRTRIGRTLHLTSLDELPYLLNVLRGDAPLLPPGTSWHDVLRALGRRPW